MWRTAARPASLVVSLAIRRQLADRQGIAATASTDDTPMRIRAAIFAVLAAILVGVIITL